MSGRLSSATERALERVRTGSTASQAARDEGIAKSTIFRALKKLRQRATAKGLAVTR